MWSQWPGALTAPMPPMPMTAAPPQPAAPPLPDAPPPPPPSNAITVPSTGFIGPLQPSATMSAGATIANTTTGNGNPYEQYTAAQYAAMTPEQQYALQQHWQQWQTYQQEYAKWHAQYGEQYKREMAAAAAAVSNPVATTPNSYMTPSYYPQAQTSAQLPIQQTSLTHQPPLPQAVRPQATRKIMGQPQMYAQPPPAAAQQHTQWTPQQQMPSELNMVPVNYNQPPPTFNTQDETSKFSIGNINQEQKMSITSLRNHIADGTPGAGFNSQWQNPLPIQNKSGSSMWSSADNHKESNETKSNASNLNLWPQSSQNRGKANNFEINREETNKDGNDAESLPSSRKSQNVYVSPNKCDEGVNSNIDSSGSEKRFVDNNAISSDFDKDRPNKFGNNGPRNYGKKTKFENNGSKIFDNKNGQNPFGNNFGNVPLNNFVNTERGDFDDAKGFGNHPLPSFGRSNNSNCQKNFDNNIPDHFNNSGCRNNQGWNLNDFNNQSDYNNWDNDAKTNQNFSPGDSINNFKSGGGGFNRPTGTNQQNYRSGGWQQQTTRKPELDDTSFDRMFEQWEKQFEDWKRANINHPDREEYRRYEQEFEKQRRRIMERREQMRRRRMGQMSANITATTNTDFLNLNQSEQQVQHNQPLHQQQSQQLHQPQQLIQEQRHSWRQQSQWQDDKQNTQEMAKSVFDMEDQRNSPKQRKITQAHNNDKSNTTNVQLNEISQIFNKQTDHNTSKNQTSQEPHTLPSLQAKQNPQNQELQQKQTLWLPNRTQQVTTEDSNEHKQQKSSQDEQKKPEQHQEGEHQKQSQIQRGFVQKQIQQNTQQRDGTQQKHNPQCPHQKQYQSNTNQSSNQQQKSTLTSLQQKQNQLKQNPPLKSNQQTSMQNLNQEVNQKKNEQKSQQLQKSDKQSPQRNPDTSQKLNQTTQKFNLNQNQNSLEQKQVQGSGDQAKTPKLNQLKPLPQRQMPQQRRQALQQASAANKQPLESNKTVYKNNKTPEIEKTSTKADQQTASGSLLGKRKSRFNPQDELIKEKREAKHSVEVITLDDDDDDDCKGSAENNEKNSVNSIFKKSEGIPGLDLVDESESKNLEDKSKSADTKSRNKTHDVGGRSDGGDVINKDRTVCNVNSKIPSLFDVVIEKPPDLSSPPPPQQQNLQFNKNVDNSALMAQLQSCNLDSMANVADALKDPQFLQQISLAVARVQGHDVPLAPSPQLLEQLPGLLQQMQQQQQQHSPTAIGSSYRSDRLYLNETQRSKNATSSSSKEKSLPTHLLQQQQVGNEGISPPLSFAEWQRRKCLASNDVSNMCGPSLGNNGSQNFNDNTQNFGNNGLQNFRNERPNMFCNNGPNNFSHNDAGRYNNFRNDQMINPSDFNNRRNFGLSGNNNNGGPCFNRGVGPMSAGGGSFNKNNCFGDNPFKRSSGLPPPVLDDNIGGARGTFSGSSGGFDKSGSGRFGEMIGRFSDPCTGGFSGSVGGGGFGGPVGEQSNMDFMRRSMRNNNACAVGPEKNEGFFRPIQVFDYQNSSAPTPKVIDYGHKHSAAHDPMEIAANKGECNENIGVGIAPGVGLPNEYKPVKTFEYGHSSNPNVKSIVKNFPPLSKNAIKKRNRKKNKLLRQQLPTLKGSHNSQQHQQQQSQQEAKDDADSAGNNVAPTALQNLAASMTSDSKPIETNIIPSRKGDKNVDLEDISDTDEIDAIENSNNTPAVPPPPSLSLTFQNSTDYSKYQLAIFPSTSSANEQVTKIGNAKHLQMSIPTMENCNTVAIDEILEKPGRLTRPKRICIILRGPPGCGKSYVAKLIKEKEIEMGGANPRILSIDDYFLIENDYEEKCSKTGKKIPKKEILYEYDDAMEETYMQYLIKSFKKTISDNLYDFIIVDCNNNSLRTLNDFYCHAKDSGFMPYIVDLFCDLETCLGRNPHDRSERDIKDVIDNWCETPFHYIKLNVSLLLENVVEMEDVENMATDEISNESVEKASAVDTVPPNTTADEGDDSNGIEGATQCGFLKSKWESDNTTESLERLDGTNKLQLHKRNTTSMADYLQLDDWQPRATSSNGKKRVRWADIEEKRKQEQMRAIGFVVGQTDWKRMMDPNAGNRALNRTKFIERVNKRQ